MNIVETIKSELMLHNEQFMSEAADKYNYWNEHVRYVLAEAKILAARHGADKEIVELGALLHDIALVSREGTRAEHHSVGAELAAALLEKYDYPTDRTERVKFCVLNHRSSKNAISIEELCVADADILAHFDNIPMLFSCLYARTENAVNLPLPEMRLLMKQSFDRDYDDLSAGTKEEFSERYKLICSIVLGEK